MAAGMHVFEAEARSFNVEHVAARLPGLPVVLVELFTRRQGLVVPPDNPRRIGEVADLAGLRLATRQADSGSYLLLQHLLSDADITPEAVDLADPPARSEADVALAVSAGKVDAGLAIESVARQFGLGFVPLCEERYDLLAWRREYFEPALQTLLAFFATAPMAERAREMGGYDLSGLGRVHFNGA